MSELMLTAIPEDVRVYAHEQHVEEYLPLLLDAAQRNFAVVPRVIIQEDHEIEDIPHIVILVQNRIGEVETFLAARDRYTREMLAIVPGPRRCIFRLGLRGQE